MSHVSLLLYVLNLLWSQLYLKLLDTVYHDELGFPSFTFINNNIIWAEWNKNWPSVAYKQAECSSDMSPEGYGKGPLYWHRG